jgi:hypothetical protein
MKIIPLGLQCSVPDAIKKANLRHCSYPLDWLWSPSKTTHTILSILLSGDDGVEKAFEYMTTGYTYYNYLNDEHYTSTPNVTKCQMNATTGLGVTHYTINTPEYKATLRRRLERLLSDIQSDDSLLFVYADAASPSLNYHLDDVEYGLDATADLLRIHDLVAPVNPNLQIVYFCWPERKQTQPHITYVPFAYQTHWSAVSEIIARILLHSQRKSKSDADTDADADI